MQMNTKLINFFVVEFLSGLFIIFQILWNISFKREKLFEIIYLL